MAKAETVSVWWSDVPSVDDQTNSTSAGATAASVALRRNASQSATDATAQVAITARSSVPSVTGAGAGAVRSTCQPPRRLPLERVERRRRGEAERRRRRHERPHDVDGERDDHQTQRRSMPAIGTRGASAPIA